MSKIIKSHRITYEEQSHSEEDDELGLDSELIMEEIKEKKIKAKREAEELLEKSKEESQSMIAESRYKANQIEEDVKRQSTIIKAAAEKKGYDEGYHSGRKQGKEEGFKEGYEEGYNKGETESNILIKEALDIKNEYIEDRNNLLKELEPQVIELVIEIYEKVLGRKMEEDKEYIVDLAISGIRNLDPTDKLTVIVSKEDFDVVEDNKEKLLVEASLINELEIKYDINLEKGDCILETPKGDIDLGIKGQVEEINDTLRKILNNE